MKQLGVSVLAFALLLWPAAHALVVVYPLEYRLNPVVGSTADSAPFITLEDIARVEMKLAGVNQPGRYLVELIHTPKGRKKFEQVANQGRERTFSTFIEGRLYSKQAFPPAQKRLYSKGTSIYGNFTQAQAEALVKEVRALISARAASQRR